MGITYKDSGVDIDGAASFIKRITPIVKSTFSKKVITDIGGFGALILRRARPCSALGPAPRDLVLLADARFVLEPNLYWCPLREASPDRREFLREAFLKSSITHSFWA